MNKQLQKIIVIIVLIVVLAQQTVFISVARAQSLEEIGQVIATSFKMIASSIAAYKAVDLTSGIVCKGYVEVNDLLDDALQKGLDWLKNKGLQKAEEEAKKFVSDKLGIKVVGSLTAVPTIDKTNIEATKRVENRVETNTKADKKRHCQDFLVKTASLIIKKRILDIMVDQLVQWIQGGGTPLFVRDFKAFREQVWQATVGDFVQQIGLSRICSPYKFQIQLALTRPPSFSQKVECTLDQIIDNFEEFKRDFNKGGFPAYVKMLEPQNNIYGAYIIALKEQQSQTEEAIAAAEAEIEAGRGFLSQKKCITWTAIDSDNNQIINIPDQGKNQPPDQKYNWKCTKAQIISPGSFIGQYITQHLSEANTGFLTKNEISAYTGAIAEAIINRFTNELIIKGLLGKSDFTPDISRAPSPILDLNTVNIRDTINAAKDMLRELQRDASSSIDKINQIQNEITDLYNNKRCTKEEDQQNLEELYNKYQASSSIYTESIKKPIDKITTDLNQIDKELANINVSPESEEEAQKIMTQLNEIINRLDYLDQTIKEFNNKLNLDQDEENIKNLQEKCGPTSS